MKYFLSFILIIIACSPPEPKEIFVQDAISECGGPYGYDCNDFLVLQKFIDVNSQIYRHYLDVDQNGIVEPLEFGLQNWDNGRLISLDLSYNHNVIMKQDHPTELDQTNYRLYVDGSSENDASYVQTDDESSYMIGASPWGTERFYGKIGSVEIYNKALSPSEISQNFEAKRKRFGV